MFERELIPRTLIYFNNNEHVLYSNAIDRPFLQKACYVISFSCFLSNNIGLMITSDKNIISVLLATTILSEITHPFPSKIKRLATTQGRRDWKPYPSAILSFSCTEEAAYNFWLGFAQRATE